MIMMGKSIRQIWVNAAITFSFVFFSYFSSSNLTMSGIDTDEHDIEPSTSGCRYVLFNLYIFFLCVILFLFIVMNIMCNIFTLNVIIVSF